MTICCAVPLIGISAFSGAGKTTLLQRLIPLLKDQGLRLALLKHAHHDFDIDHPGKDSYQLRKAGAEQVLVASRQRVALIRESQGPQRDPGLAELLPYIDTNGLDLILVEGFKREPIPKIELHRPALGHPFIHARDHHVIAVASDAPLILVRDIPLLDLNDPADVASFIIERTGVGACLARAV